MEPFGIRLGLDADTLTKLVLTAAMVGAVEFVRAAVRSTTELAVQPRSVWSTEIAKAPELAFRALDGRAAPAAGGARPAGPAPWESR